MLMCDFVSPTTAIDMLAVLLVSRVVLSVGGQGYLQTAYFLISKCCVYAPTVQQWHLGG